MLVKPAPILGESWPGYLLRLSELNQYSGLSSIARSLGLTRHRLIAENPSNILLLLGIAPPEHVNLFRSAPHSQRAVLGRHGRSNRSRICPRCIAEMHPVHIPSVWDGAIDWKCKKHNLLLIDTCHACGAEVTYERRFVGYCICGSAFSSAPRLKESGSQLFDISEALSPVTEEYVSGVTFQASSEHQSACAHLIQRLKILTDRAPSSSRTSSSLGDCFISSQVAVGVSHWFSDWPNEFIRELNLASQFYGRSPATLLGQTNKGLGGIGGLSRIVDAVRQLVASKRTAKRPKSLNLLSTVPTPALRRVGLTYVLRRSGTTYDVVLHWIRVGYLGAVEGLQLPNGQWRFKIERERADKAIQVALSTSSPKKLAAEIGIDPRALRALGYAGVLHIVPFGAAKYNFRLIPSQTFDLVSKLQKVAIKGKRSSTKNILVETAILRLYKSDPLRLSALISTFLNGSIVVRKYDEQVVRFDDLTMRLDDYVQWRQRVKHK